MTSRSVVGTYYVIAGLYTLAAALIWGINTLFLLDAGLDIFEVFLANAVFTAGIFVFEIPTGVVADTLGRRVSFLLSVLILIASTLGYVVAAKTGGELGDFMVASLFLGLGFTFYSGAVEAWLVDALKATGHAGNLDRVFARGAMVTGSAMLIGTLGGGLLGSVDLALPYLVRTGLLVVVLIVAMLAMRDLGFRPRPLTINGFPREMQRVARQSVAYGWHHPGIRLFMGVAFIQWGFMSWAFYAWPPYFLELLGRNAVWVSGAVASAIAASTIVGNTIVDWLARGCRRRTTLIICAALVQSVAAVGVGLAPNFATAVGLLLIATAAMGVSGPVTQAYLHDSTPGEYRASVISAVSMLGNGGGIAGQGGLGYLARARSVPEAYVVGGVLTLLAWPLLLGLRRLNQDADWIRDEPAGHPAPCAGQGIPEATQIDANARHSASAS